MVYIGGVLSMYNYQLIIIAGTCIGTALSTCSSQAYLVCVRIVYISYIKVQRGRGSHAAQEEPAFGLSLVLQPVPIMLHCVLMMLQY